MLEVLNGCSCKGTRFGDDVADWVAERIVDDDEPVRRSSGSAPKPTRRFSRNTDDVREGLTELTFDFGQQPEVDGPLPSAAGEVCRVQGTVPTTLIVQTPNGMQYVGGRYGLLRTRLVNGHPVWKKRDKAGIWIYSAPNSRWYISSSAAAKGFQVNQGHLRSSSKHEGRLPHAMAGDWRRKDRADWLEDPEITVLEADGPDDDKISLDELKKFDLHRRAAKAEGLALDSWAFQDCLGITTKDPASGMVDDQPGAVSVCCSFGQRASREPGFDLRTRDFAEEEPFVMCDPEPEDELRPPSYGFGSGISAPIVRSPAAVSPPSVQVDRNPMARLEGDDGL